MIPYERIFAEINLDAIGHNTQIIKKSLSPQTQLMAVVKADGYGHGAIEVSKQAIKNGADLLGVAIIEEALQLRQSGITEPITILGVNFPFHIQTALDYNLTQTVFTLETASMISECAVQNNVIAKVQIKIDSGMGRIGFACTQAALKECLQVFCLPNLKVTGIYTHLSCADDADCSYTHYQNKQFMAFINALRKNGVAIPPIHVANSAATVHYEQLHYDAVRAGLILYGLYPYDTDQNNPLSLIPAMSLKARITYVKLLPKGESVGYGAAFTTKKDTLIATVGAGYGDGYPRLLSCRGRVLVHGKSAPIVGRVCMDQFMCDVTGIPDVALGDEVVLFGRGQGSEISAYEIAKHCQSITHDVVCMVGKRVPRSYIKDGKVTKTIYLS